jgi:dihydrofolate reductase
MISLIVAMSQTRVIGKDNALPWRIPADLKHFKALTLGKPVIMGRKTFESIGKPLPERTNIVVSRSGFRATGVITAVSLPQALDIAHTHGEEAMVIGGAEIYRQALPMADCLYLTEVHADIGGDAIFPEINPQVWCEVSREHHDDDTSAQFPYSFVTLKKKG